MTIGCAPTSRWYGAFLAVVALVFVSLGVLFPLASGFDGAGLGIGAILLALGVGILAAVGRACFTHVTISATDETLTLDAPAYFREPLTIPRAEIYGIFVGTRPMIGPASSRHSALVVSLPRTNLGIRFKEDRCIVQARPLWSTLVNDVWFKMGGRNNNSTPVPSPKQSTRGILVRVNHPEEAARSLAELLNTDTGAIW